MLKRIIIIFTMLAFAVDWHFLVTAWLQIIITAYAAVLQYIITISGFPSPPSADLRLCASVEKEDMG